MASGHFFKQPITLTYKYGGPSSSGLNLVSDGGPAISFTNSLSAGTSRVALGANFLQITATSGTVSSLFRFYNDGSLTANTFNEGGTNLSSKYLGINATAVDSLKLDGIAASGYALSSHNHSANEITTGTLVVARGGTGLSTAASGVVFAGPGSGANAAPSWRALIATDIPSLDANKITTGTLAIARGGTGASSVASGAVFVGPSSGANAAPSFRRLVAGDIPDLSATYLGVNATAADSDLLGGVAPSGYVKSSGSTTTSGLTLTSAGSVTLTLEADTDNVTETDVPTLLFKQDGGGITGQLGLNDSNHLVLKHNSNTAAESLILATGGAANALSIRASDGLATFSGNVNAPSFMVNGTGLEDRIRHTTSAFLLGNQDWSSIIYAKSGAGTYAYDATNRGMKFTNQNETVRLRVRMPVDPDSQYYCRVKTKKIDGTGSIYVGAISLDNSFNEIATDTANGFNYFVASNVTLSGTQYFEGVISGYNLTTEGNHSKFDPEAKYFDLVLYLNYLGGGGGAGNTVVERLELWRVSNMLMTDTPTANPAGLRLPHGVAPTSPVNGDIWTTTGGLYARINGTTVGPYTSNTGTVTSVALSLPNIFTVTGSPVTSSGTLTAALANASSGVVFAGPGSGAAAAPTFRALVATDIPSLDASKIASGTLVVARGGTGAATASSGMVFAGPGSGAAAAPAFRALVETDIPSLNASKIGAGTLGVARGGTGLATATQYGIVYGNGTSALGVTSSGAAAQILLGGATAPTWQAAPTTSKQVLTSTSTSALSWQTLDLTYLPDSWLKKSVLVATTANITLSGTQTIDGVAVVANDRVLVKNQTDAKTNGIYAVSSGAWTRVTGADTPSELAGATVSVDRGAANGGRIFSTNFASNQAIGTDNINWYELTDTRTTFRSDTSNSVDVRFAPGDGRGVRFWDSENYKIWMSAAGHATYGGEVDTTSDYNMYFQMSGAGASATRGFVWKGSYNSGAATTLAHLTTNGFHLNSGDYKVGETTVIDTSRNISGVNGVFSGSITEGGTALSNKYEDRLKKIKGVPSLAYSFNTDFVSKRTLTQVPLPTAAWWGTFYKGYVWVRSWTTNTLFKINPSDFSVTSITIPGATGTGTVACGGGYIWVSNSTGNSIVRVNPDTDAIVDTITVTNTRKMVFDGMHMWALNESTGTITRIHATTLTQTSITLSGTTRLVFDGSHVWAVRSASNLLEKIDISTVTSVGSVTAGANLRGTIFDGRHIWTIDYGNENLIKIDPNTNAVVSTITGLSGSANLSSELGFDGTFIWLPVSSGTAHTIKLIDPISHATVYTISTPIDFSSIVFDGEAMWFGNTSASSFQRVYV